MKEILLTQGKVTLVDDEDYESLSKFKWHASLRHGNYYANRCSLRETIYMHRSILNIAAGVMIDHKSGNTLDNRRENLRSCNSTQNSRNRKPIGNSGYKGVCFDYSRGLWMAAIQISSKPKTVIRLGRFKSVEEAAQAYNEAAEHYFGEFAYGIK